MSIKNHKSFELMVRRFSSNDEYRHSMSKPIIYQNGWVASTNSNKLLWFNDSEFIKRKNIFEYSKNEGVNALSILEKYSEIYDGNQQPIGKINLKHIHEVFRNIKKEPEYQDTYKDCNECDGCGTVECGCCGSETICDECGGEGSVICGEEETGFFKYPYGEYIKIKDNYFNLSEFDEILEYLGMVDVSELDVYFTNDDGKSFYGIPEERIYILLKGINYIGLEIEKEHIIEIL